MMRGWLSVEAFLITVVASLAFAGGGPPATPQRAATVADCDPVCLNELFPLPCEAAPGDAFIELYNPTDGEVDVGGWVVSVSQGSQLPVRYTVPPARTVAPGGFLVLWGSETGLFLPETGATVML